MKLFQTLTIFIWIFSSFEICVDCLYKAFSIRAPEKSEKTFISIEIRSLWEPHNVVFYVLECFKLMVRNVCLFSNGSKSWRDLKE